MILPLATSFNSLSTTCNRMHGVSSCERDIYMHVRHQRDSTKKGKGMKSSFELQTLIVTLRASRSGSEETPPSETPPMTAGMQETEGALPPVASVALFALPPGSLLLCPGCSIVAGGVPITSGVAAAVLAAGVTNTPGVGAGATTTAGVGTAGAAVPELLPTMLGTGMGPCPPRACQFASDCIISGRRVFIVFATSSWTSCGSMFTFSSSPRT